MTKLGPTDVKSENLKCGWCRRAYTATRGPGRPRRFCKRSCRQRDFEARSRAKAHGIDERDLIIARTDFDQLRDDVYVLACALDDAELDLAGAVSVAECLDIVRSIVLAAQPLLKGSHVRP